MNIDYLRVSVTGRCNLKCIYCHPPGDQDMAECGEFLSLKEIRRVVKLFAQCGIKKVRLTGGEPLLRDNILGLVRELSSIDAVEELSVTTNGVHLESLAAGLKAAGLNRVNISLDSFNRSSYEKITGFDLLPDVIRGIYKAIEVGLMPVKINCVVIKDVNDSSDEITALARMSVNLPVIVRFVEYYPTNRNSVLTKEYVPSIDVRKIIENEFGRLDDISVSAGYGPAVNFRIKNSAGGIGFISGRSSMFCGQCNRLRLTSDGKIKPCLYSSAQYDLKELLSNGSGDEEILRLLEKIIREKSRYTKLNSPLEEFSMQSIGG